MQNFLKGFGSAFFILCSILCGILDYGMQNFDSPVDDNNEEQFCCTDSRTCLASSGKETLKTSLFDTPDTHLNRLTEDI